MRHFMQYPCQKGVDSAQSLSYFLFALHLGDDFSQQGIRINNMRVILYEFYESKQHLLYFRVADLDDQLLAESHKINRLFKDEHLPAVREIFRIYHVYSSRPTLKIFRPLYTKLFRLPFEPSVGKHCFHNNAVFLMLRLKRFVSSRLKTLFQLIAAMSP